MAVQLGNLAEWAAAVGTVGALWATSMVIRRDHRRQQDEHDERLYDEARLVTGDFGYVVEPGSPSAYQASTRVQVRVYNGSRRPIHRVKLVLWTPEKEVHAARSLFALAPDEEVAFTVEPRRELMRADGGYDAGLDLEFTDFAGRRWSRNPRGFLGQMARPPAIPPWRRWTREYRSRTFKIVTAQRSRKPGPDD